uniref:PAP-associated domain-containing protein n=1 Tax=Panagrolaimus sp. ES5 TaxID=591445 RepID=A0AC34FVB5_9BILA
MSSECFFDGCNTLFGSGVLRRRFPAYTGPYYCNTHYWRLKRAKAPDVVEQNEFVNDPEVGDEVEAAALQNVDSNYANEERIQELTDQVNNSTTVVNQLQVQAARLKEEKETTQRILENLAMVSGHMTLLDQGNLSAGALQCEFVDNGSISLKQRIVNLEEAASDTAKILAGVLEEIETTKLQLQKVTKEKSEADDVSSKMTKEINDLRGDQDEFKNKIDILKTENQVLRNRISNFRDKIKAKLITTHAGQIEAKDMKKSNSPETAVYYDFVLENTAKELRELLVKNGIAIPEHLSLQAPPPADQPFVVADAPTSTADAAISSKRKAQYPLIVSSEKKARIGIDVNVSVVAQTLSLVNPLHNTLKINSYQKKSEITVTQVNNVDAAIAKEKIINFGAYPEYDVTQVEKIVDKLKEDASDIYEKTENDIWIHYDINLQDQKTIKLKESARDHLERACQRVFPSAELYIVGSTMNGCGAYNSDMDICVLIKQEALNHARNYALNALQSLRNAFQRLPIIREVILIKAVVPILQITFKGDFADLEADININNVAGIYNTHLIHHYCRHDKRFPALCLLIKHFARNAGINSAKDGTFNSYSLSLLVLHYMQCACQPPVMPNLQESCPNIFDGQVSVENLRFFDDEYSFESCNHADVTALLIGFFAYYAGFDFNTYGISIRRGQVFLK